MKGRGVRLGVAVLATAVAVAVSGPVWAAVRAPVRPAAEGSEVAGYGMGALASAVRYQLNSPGLLPVGDAAEGNIFGVDMPFARITVTAGPVMGVVASPLYPGDTAAHLGTALATFGAPGIPNYPVIAEANYPPAPGFGQDAAFAAPAIPGVGVGNAASHADANGATAEAHVSSLAVPTDAPLIGVGSSRSFNKVTVQPDLVTTTAEAHTGTITIAGLITIADVSASATASSDGAKAKPAAQLEIGKVTVAGQPAYIDADGLHLVGQQPVGTGVAPGVETLLAKTLAEDGISIRTVSPRTTSDAGLATADAGGLVVILERTVPALGIPGVGSIPGVPVPLGTPDLPLHIELTFGTAKVGVNATGVPVDAIATDASGPSAEVSGSSEVAELDPVGAGSSATAALGPSTGGSRPTSGLQPAASTGRRAPVGAPIPVPWIIAGVLVSIMLCGPLLGYARWQLLEGRSR
jgi:hypothetical protein